MKDKDILELFGLTDRTITVSLEDEIMDTMDKFLKETEEHEQRKQEFISLFKECYDELCEYMEKDPKRRVSVNCFTCIRGMNLRDQYGKPKK